MSETPSEPVENPTGDPVEENPQGDPAEEPELTWEALAEKGFTSPADVLKLADELGTWKKHAKTWEDRSKANKRELDKLAKANLSEDERKIEEIKAAARSEIMGTVGTRLAKAALLEAMTGKVADPREALELLDLKRFVTDEGEVDDSAVEAAVERLAKLAPATGTQKPPKVDRGPRTGGTPQQWTRKDLQGKSPEQIDDARRKGHLDDLLSGKND